MDFATVEKICRYDVLFLEAIREYNFKGKIAFDKEIFIPDIELSKQVIYDSCKAMYIALDRLEKTFQKDCEINGQHKNKYQEQKLYKNILQIKNKCNYIDENVSSKEIPIEPFANPIPWSYDENYSGNHVRINKLSIYAKHLATECKTNSNNNIIDIEYKSPKGVYFVGKYLITMQAAYAISYHYSRSSNPKAIKINESDFEEKYKIGKAIGLREVIAADVTIVDKGETYMIIRKWTPLRATGIHISRSTSLELLYDGDFIWSIQTKVGALIQFAFHFNNTFSVTEIQSNENLINMHYKFDKKEWSYPSNSRI